MKLTTAALVALAALAALAVATPMPDAPAATVDCGFCTEMLEFCFMNGHTPGQTGCLQTCREHVCHRTPACRKCRGEFERCPAKSRYHN